MTVEYRELNKHRGYRVGDDGSVWSEWEYGFRTGRWHQLRGHRLKYGHISVMMKSGTDYIHRLVLEAFVGPCPTGMECRHLNGNASDNRLVNLIWGTSKENGEDWVRHGTCPRGEAVKKGKLKTEDVREIWDAIRCGECMKVLANRFGVTLASIRAIANGTSWNHITGLAPHPSRERWRKTANDNRQARLGRTRAV